MSTAPPTISPEDLKHILDHLSVEPGEECPSCHRKVPVKKPDDKTGPRRSVIHVNEPKGQEGTLEDLMIQVVDKYKEQWPREYADMRAGIGLDVVGALNWRFHVLHFALYAVLMVPGLEPTE